MAIHRWFWPLFPPALQLDHLARSLDWLRNSEPHLAAVNLTLQAPSEVMCVARDASMKHITGWCLRKNPSEKYESVGMMTFPICRKTNKSSKPPIRSWTFTYPLGIKRGEDTLPIADIIVLKPPISRFPIAVCDYRSVSRTATSHFHGRIWLCCYPDFA